MQDTRRWYPRWPHPCLRAFFRLCWDAARPAEASAAALGARTASTGDSPSLSEAEPEGVSALGVGVCPSDEASDPAEPLPPLRPTAAWAARSRLASCIIAYGRFARLSGGAGLRLASARDFAQKGQGVRVGEHQSFRARAWIPRRNLSRSSLMRE